jgi:pyruvate dehydrogenase E1 component alpha subunit
VTAVPSPAADRAPAYGLAAATVDGNDVVAVAEAVAQAAARARSGDGPALIEALTYRHFGHSRTDPAKYRPAEEVRQWLERDPLELARQRLAQAGVPASSVTQAAERAAETVAHAIADAKAAPPPEPADAFTDVWADGGSAWRT